MLALILKKKITTDYIEKLFGNQNDYFKSFKEL